MRKGLVSLCAMSLIVLSLSASPAFASSSRPTIAESHAIYGIQLATHYMQPYWTWDGTKLLSTHSGTNWDWTNLIVSSSVYDPYWISYPAGLRSYGVFYSKVKFCLGISIYGLPLGYSWTCQLAAHCYYNGSSSYGHTCGW